MEKHEDQAEPGEPGAGTPEAPRVPDAEMGGEAPCQLHQFWDEGEAEASDAVPELSPEMREAVEAVKRHRDRPR